MKRKHEVINGHNISVWFNKNCFDKFTVVYLDEVDEQLNVPYIGMSDNPFHPQGFGQHGKMKVYNVAYKGRGGCFDKRIKFAELPVDCQWAVIQDLSHTT
jgi:hypothetical protein